MSDKNRKQSSGRRGKASRPWVHRALRITFWCTAGLCLALLVLAGSMGIGRLFFSSNPHFTLQDIRFKVAKGELDVDAIRGDLELPEGETSLFAVDVHALREALLQNPLIQEAEVRRILPSALEITLFGRTPVAQLLRPGGRLVDPNGILLPASTRRESRGLPVITGIPGLNEVPNGELLDDEMVATALRFLALRDARRNGHWLDIEFVQLDRSYRELRVFLRGRPDLYIRDGCLVTMPVKDMDRALTKALRILEMRAQAHQPTSSINLLYEKVPVLP